MRGWCREHWIPLAASVIFFFIGFDYVIMWAGLRTGQFDVWLSPSDMWGTWLGAAKLVHGNLSVYATNPGPVLLFVPVAWPGHALGLTVGPDWSAYFAPTGWLLAGPYVLALSCLPIFGADNLARRWGVSPSRRLTLAIAEAAILGNVTIKWGHPEDAVAVGLVLFAVDRASRGEWNKVGWLLGFAVLVQPFSLLALPSLAVAAWTSPNGQGRSDVWRVVWRTGVPYGTALAGALLFDWSTATRWLLHQPNWPEFNHRTPFTFLATPVAHSLGGVSSGPSRTAALVVATVLAVILGRRRVADDRILLWIVAASLAVWVVLETVDDAYYVWPTLAIALLLAANRGWARFGATVAVSLFATWFSNAQWGGVWPWWSVMMGLLFALLVLGWPARARAADVEPAAVALAPSAAA